MTDPLLDTHDHDASFMSPTTTPKIEYWAKQDVI